MNLFSIAHTTAHKQIYGSSLTGVRTMLEKDVHDYATALVRDYGTYNGYKYALDLDNIPSLCKNELARLYIESIDRDIEYACYGADESINSDYLCALLAMLANDCKETRERFAEVTHKNIFIYYEKQLQEIIDNACYHYKYQVFDSLALDDEEGFFA